MLNAASFKLLRHTVVTWSVSLTVGWDWGPAIFLKLLGTVLLESVCAGIGRHGVPLLRVQRLVITVCGFICILCLSAQGSLFLCSCTVLCHLFAIGCLTVIFLEGGLEGGRHLRLHL